MRIHEIRDNTCLLDDHFSDQVAEQTRKEPHGRDCSAVWQPHRANDADHAGDKTGHAIAGKHNCALAQLIPGSLTANQDLRIALSDTSVDLYQETVATYNILEAMRHHSIKQIVYTSSGTVYGDTPVVPIPENYGPTLPISLYGAGKLGGEALITAFCHTFDMQAWIFRFANIIGPRATHAVMYDFVN